MCCRDCAPDPVIDLAPPSREAHAAVYRLPYLDRTPTSARWQYTDSLFGSLLVVGTEDASEVQRCRRQSGLLLGLAAPPPHVCPHASAAHWPSPRPRSVAERVLCRRRRRASSWKASAPRFSHGSHRNNSSSGPCSCGKSTVVRI